MADNHDTGTFAHPEGMAEPPPLPPPTVEPEPSTSHQTWRWLLASGGLVAAAVIVLLVVLLLRSNSDKDEAQKALAATESDLDALVADLSEAETEASGLRTELAAVSDALAEADADLSGASEALATSETALATAEDMLEERDEAAAEVEEVVVDFIGLSLAGGAGLDASASSCMAQIIYENTGISILADMMAAGLGDAQSAGVAAVGLEMIAAADECGVSLPDFESGFRYGDNPVLDQLQDECIEGSGAACDELYWQSPADSEYERIGITCGERFSPDSAPIACEGNIDPDQP